MADFPRNCPPVKPGLAHGVRKVEETVWQKKLEPFFRGMTPHRKAARLVQVTAASPAPGTRTWVASCSNKDQNAFPKRPTAEAARLV